MKKRLLGGAFLLLVISMFDYKEHTQFAFSENYNMYNSYYIELDSMNINTKNINNYLDGFNIITYYSDSYNILSEDDLYYNNTANNLNQFEEYIKNKLYQKGYTTISNQILISGVKLKAVKIYAKEEDVDRLIRQYKFDYKKA